MNQLGLFEEVPAGSISKLTDIPASARQHQADDAWVAVEILKWIASWEEHQWVEVIQDSGQGRFNLSGSGRLATRTRILHLLGEAIFWAIGDEINDKIGEVGRMASYRAAAEAIGADVRWTMELAKVAALFPQELRYAGVRWNLYRACASQPEPRKALREAIEHGWTADQVRKRERAK